MKRLWFVFFGGHDEDGFRWPCTDRVEMAKPHWWFTFATTTLPCGCTRRKLTHRFTLYEGRCQTHLGELAITDAP